MKHCLIFFTLLFAGLLIAGNAVPVAEWDFTQGKNADTTGKYSFILRGGSKFTEKGLVPAESDPNVKGGAAVSKRFPELSPAAFRLTITFTPADKLPEKRDVFFLWDNKYYHFAPKKETPAANHGFMVFLAKSKRGTLYVRTGIGFGERSEFFGGPELRPQAGKPITLTVEYDGIKTVRFRSAGYKDVVRTSQIGGPVSPAVHNTAFGDRIMGLHHPFAGSIQKIVLESLPVPAFAAVPDFRAAFRRAEKDAVLELKLTDYTGFRPAEAELKGKDGIVRGKYPVKFTGILTSDIVRIPVKTNLQPGTYPCTVTLKGTVSGKQLTAAVPFDLFIGPRLHEGDQMRFFWNFPAPYHSFMKPMGFTHLIQGWWGTLDHKKGEFRPHIRKLRHDQMDRMLAEGMLYGESTVLAHDKILTKQYPRILKNGSKWEKNMDIGNPEAFRKTIDLAEKSARQIGDHPAMGLLLPVSEIRDRSRPSFTEHTRKAWKDFSGTEIPAEADDRVPPHYTRLKNFPAGRIVPDNWPLLAFYRWFWKTGDGWNPWMDAVAAAFRKEIKVPFKSFYDPSVRVPPLWGNGGDTVDYLNQWTYPYPEPFNISYVISEQMAMARRNPSKYKVMTMVQGISYRTQIAPKGKKVANPPFWTKDRPNVTYMTTPPDVMREALWTMFSRQMEGIGVFAWRALFDASPYGRPKNGDGYQMTHPGTREVIREEMQKAAVPLGPLFRAFPERKPEVAVLESYASTLFAQRGSWGWKGPIYDYGVLFTRAKLAPYVVYEEEIARQGIPGTVKVLILHQCDVLTESAFKGIQEFQRRGGIIVSDTNSVPGLMTDLKLPEYRRTSAADKDKANMLNVCARLRKTLAPYYEPYADSENPDLLPIVRTDGNTDLLFVLNDKRTFGDYVGMYGLLMEKGLPNEGTVTLNRKAGAVYDLVLHKAVPFSVKDGKTVIPVKFSTNDGKALLVTESPLKALNLSVKSSGRTLQIAVASPEKDVMRPIRLTVCDEKGTLSDDSGYGVIKDGIFRREVLLPENGFSGKITVTVEDLATGRKTVDSVR